MCIEIRKRCVELWNIYVESRRAAPRRGVFDAFSYGFVRVSESACKSSLRIRRRFVIAMCVSKLRRKSLN